MARIKWLSKTTKTTPQYNFYYCISHLGRVMPQAVSRIVCHRASRKIKDHWKEGKIESKELRTQSQKERKTF